MTNLAGCWSKLTKGERDTIISVLNAYGDSVEFRLNNAILASVDDTLAYLLKYKHRTIRRREAMRDETGEFMYASSVITRIQRIIRKVEQCQTSSNTGADSRRRIRNAS